MIAAWKSGVNHCLQIPKRQGGFTLFSPERDIVGYGVSRCLIYELQLGRLTDIYD